MPRHARDDSRPTAAREAFTRAVDEGPKLPARFTDEPDPDMGAGGRRITDTLTGRHSDMLVSYFPVVRRVLSELFPDET